MKYLYSISTLLLAVILFSSCEKVVDVKLENSESKPVVEGLVTNQPGMSYVKLTQSGSYFDVQHPEYIGGAVVEISDNNGDITIFHESSPGYYIPDAAFTGKVGQTYTLKVITGNSILMAHSFMRQVAEIEKITTKFFDENNAEGREKGYYAYVSFFELPGEGDSYKIDLYANGESMVKKPGDLFFFDDRFIDGGHAVDWDFDATLKKGDSITMKMYSLSPEGYKFYAAMLDIGEAGGLFGKNPANIPTNIIGDAFGYFGASAISFKSAVAE